MMLHKLLQFILFFYICNAEILLLNSNTFDSTLKSYPLAMVNFYADWCHFCRALSPIYDQSATILDKEIKEKKLLLAKVDCVDQASLASRFGINKYPTLKIFHYGIPAHNEYRGERSADSIVASMKKLAEPQYTVIPTTKNIDVIPEFKTVFHGLVKDNKSPNFQIFSKIASIMSGYSLFYLSYDPKAIEEIRFMDKSKVKELLKLAGQNSDTVLEWVRARAIPFVRELTFTNAEEITEEEKPLVVFFYSPNDIKSKRIFTEMVSKQLIDIQTVNFLTADGNTFIHPLRHLSKTIEDLPLIVIDSFQHMYIYKESIPQTLEDPKPLREFVNDLKSGKLHREYHYGPDPKQTKTPKKSIFKELAPNENRYSVKDEF